MTPRQIALMTVLGAASWLPVLVWLNTGLFVLDGITSCLGAVVVGCWTALEEGW